jgi:hypothetical protein
LERAANVSNKLGRIAVDIHPEQVILVGGRHEFVHRQLPVGSVGAVQSDMRASVRFFL